MMMRVGDVEEEGEERPALVFLHGFLGSSEDFQGVEQRLATQGQWPGACYFLDLPGHGRSPLPEERVDLAAMAADVLNFLDGKGLRRVVLGGYSMGARIALCFALHHRDRLSGLVLESCSPGISDGEERRHRAALDDERAAKLGRIGLPAFLREWYAMPLFDSLRARPDFEEIVARRERGDSEALARVLSEMSPGRQPDLWPQLSALTTPTLFIAGEEDQKYVEIGEKMADCVSGLTLCVAPGCGHNVHLENPVFFVESLRRFLVQNF